METNKKLYKIKSTSDNDDFLKIMSIADKDVDNLNPNLELEEINIEVDHMVKEVVVNETSKVVRIQPMDFWTAPVSVHQHRDGFTSDSDWSEPTINWGSGGWDSEKIDSVSAAVIMSEALEIAVRWAEIIDRLNVDKKVTEMND